MALPNYVYSIVLACALGACSGQEDCEPDLDPKCVCSPQMKVRVEAPEGGNICNNATFDWMVHTMLAEVSTQKNVNAEQGRRIEELKDDVAARWVTIDQLEGKVADMRDEVTKLEDSKQGLLDANKQLKDENTKLLAELEDFRAAERKAKRPKDCADVQKQGARYSGLYSIHPEGYEEGLEVFCDLNTDGGGWMVVQRRQDGSQRFDRSWETYKWGFGQNAREFWFGNEHLHKVTSQKAYEMRIDLQSFEGEDMHAIYDHFSVDGENDSYKLHIGGYVGTAGDAMAHHDGSMFTTKDMDNDLSRSGQCSHLYGWGGWWYVRCYDSNLNGQYKEDGVGKDGIVWYQWKGNQVSMRFVEMKIRPAGFSAEA